MVFNVMNFHGKWNQTNSVFTTEVKPQFKTHLRSKIQRCEKLNGRVQILTCYRTKWQFLESYGNGYEMSQMYQTVRVVLRVFWARESDPIWKWHCRFYYSMSRERSLGVKIVVFRDTMWPHILWNTIWPSKHPIQTQYCFYRTKILV